MSERREHTEFINHIMGCSRCYAPNDRYCDAGRELWIEDKVGFVLAHSSYEERKGIVATIRAVAPNWSQTIEGRIRERFKVKGNGGSK